MVDITPDGWSYIRYGPSMTMTTNLAIKMSTPLPRQQYIYYGPHYDVNAARPFNLAVFNFANAANNFVNTANAINAATTPTQRRPARAGRTSTRGNRAGSHTNEPLPKGRSSTAATACTNASSNKADVAKNDLILLRRPSFQATYSTFQNYPCCTVLLLCTSTFA